MLCLTEKWLHDHKSAHVWLSLSPHNQMRPNPLTSLANTEKAILTIYGNNTFILVSPAAKDGDEGREGRQAGRQTL